MRAGQQGRHRMTRMRMPTAGKRTKSTKSGKRQDYKLSSARLFSDRARWRSNKIQIILRCLALLGTVLLVT